MIQSKGSSTLDETRSLSSDAFQDLSLEQWITKFGKIYGKRHDKHTTEYMISRLVEEVAELVSPMESRGDLGPGLADVFSWTCSLAYKLNLDLAALAWKKYGMNPPKNKRNDKSFELNDFSQPRSLSEWQFFVSELYRQENSTLSPMNALVSLMKDVGDLSMLNRKRVAPDQVTSKLAAILAWTMTLAQLLNLDLSDLVYQKYDSHCPVCRKETCDTDICHPLVNMFVSFGTALKDEDKYALLDTVGKFGFHAILDNSTQISSTRDLSTAFDLISKCDAACIVLANENVSTENASDYRQIYEVLTCFSLLSKGNVWLFARGGSAEFKSYLERVFALEKVSVITYSDPGHLRAVLESQLRELETKKRNLIESS